MKLIYQILITLVIIAIILFCSKIYFWQKDESIKPLNYSTIADLILVSKKITSFERTAQELFSLAQECDKKQPIEYFEDLVAKFAKSEKIIYRFESANANPTPHFIVTLLPNKANYSSLAEFRNDFELCHAAGETYPKMLNQNWLLFVSSCGSGYDDKLGLSRACDEIKNIIEPSLKLN